MTLNQYIKKLKKVASEGHGSRQIIYAKDDEGNDYGEVFFDPAPVYYDSDERSIADPISSKPANAVIIN